MRLILSGKIIMIEVYIENDYFEFQISFLLSNKFHYLYMNNSYMKFYSSTYPSLKEYFLEKEILKKYLTQEERKKICS